MRACSEAARAAVNLRARRLHIAGPAYKRINFNTAALHVAEASIAQLWLPNLCCRAHSRNIRRVLAASHTGHTVHSLSDRHRAPALSQEAQQASVCKSLRAGYSVLPLARLL